MVAVLLLAWVGSAEAQRWPRRPASPFHVGQKVEFEYWGKIRSGEIVSINNTFGTLTIRFEENGAERTWGFPPAQVWLPKKSAASSAQPKAPVFTWTDSTGLYKIEARFLELKDGKVTLEKEDGSTKTLPLDKLSEDDQRRAKKYAEKMPPANPFGDSDNTDASSADKAAEPVDDLDIVAQDGDWSSVRDILPDALNKGPFVADTAGGERLERMHTFMLDLNKGSARRDFRHEKLAGFFLDRPRQRMVVASTNDEIREGRRARGSRSGT